MTSSVYMAAHTCHCGRNFTFIIHLTVPVQTPWVGALGIYLELSHVLLVNVVLNMTLLESTETIFPYSSKHCQSRIISAQQNCSFVTHSHSYCTLIGSVGTHVHTLLSQLARPYSVTNHDILIYISQVPCAILLH